MLQLLFKLSLANYRISESLKKANIILWEIYSHKFENILKSHKKKERSKFSSQRR